MQDENSAETSNTDGVKDDESTTPSPPEPLKADEAAGDDDKQEVSLYVSCSQWLLTITIFSVEPVCFSLFN